jgi:hypothetical protein
VPEAAWGFLFERIAAHKVFDRCGEVMFLPRTEMRLTNTVNAGCRASRAVRHMVFMTIWQRDPGGGIVSS